MKAARYAVFACAVLYVSGAAPAANAADPRRLQYEQQQDTLNLRLQQSLRARQHELAPDDARRLNQLQLQQRLEQHQLEIQQVQRDRALRQSGSIAPEFRDRTLDAQHELFAQERQLQIQRFELDQQRLIQSARPQPLQPPLGAPQSTLPLP
jgi:hypothetical protein